MNLSRTYRLPFSLAKVTICLWLVLSCQVTCYGQEDYSLSVQQTTVETDSAKLKGYMTSFTQSFKDVKKAWWKYIKEKAVIFNKVSHYELKIPAKGDSTESVHLVSKLNHDEEKNTSLLEVGVRDENLSDKQRVSEELRQMLLDFKVSFYVAPLQREINRCEKSSARLSAKINKYQSTDKLPKGISEDQLDSLVSSYADQLDQTTQRLDSLKDVLNDIK